MKSVVLISALSFLGVQFSPETLYRFPETFCVTKRDVLLVKSGDISNAQLVALCNFGRRNQCRFSPLRPGPESSPGTLLPTPVSILAEKSKLKIASRRLFQNRKRLHKYKPYLFKPSRAQVKVPP